jgi:2-hydroxy-3-oxopropionate reductase
MSAVAFLGLGTMGLPMAGNLAGAGFEVRAWNRSPRADPAPSCSTRAAFTQAASPAEAASGASVIVTMLPDLPEVRAVCDGPTGALASARPGAVLLVMGTVSPTGVRQYAAELAARGFELVDAPVSGGDVGARDGTLSIMAGGTDAAMNQVMPVLRAMGSVIRHCGPVGSGQLVKACNQIVVAATLTALGEALVLGRRGGIDTTMLLDVLAGGLAGSRALDVKRDKLVSRTFELGGSASFQHKDLGFALEAARAAGVALPLTAVVDQLFGSMRWTGRGGLDHSGIIQVLEVLSGGAEHDE